MDNLNPTDKKTQQDIDYPPKASRLGTAVVIKGEISGEDNLVIEGRIQGKVDVKGKTIVIEQQAVVDAEIITRDVIVAGELNGNISAAGKVSITPTGRMNGDISAARISIADGSQFKGKIKILPHS